MSQSTKIIFGMAPMAHWPKETQEELLVLLEKYQVGNLDNAHSYVRYLDTFIRSIIVATLIAPATLTTLALHIHYETHSGNLPYTPRHLDATPVL